jgi:hypothetical protein
VSEKACRRCGIVKPLDLFPRNCGRRDGHHSQCKACHREIQRAIAAKPPPIPIGPRIVRLPRRRYDRCPRCASRGIIRDSDDDGQSCLTCGWQEPLYAVSIHNAQGGWAHPRTKETHASDAAGVISGR